MSSDAVERPLGRVDDILTAILEIESFVVGRSEAGFIADRMRVLAVTHLIMIIGEAAKNLATGIEERCPDIPWRDIRSMRDRIVHEYGTTNPRMVWQVAANELAPLRTALLAERGYLMTAGP
jgi:uncharacterized protein with HEPN domain